MNNHKVFSKHISYSTVWENGPNGFKEDNSYNLPSLGIHGLGNVDIGNIMDRSPNEYYVSEPYESTHDEKIYSLDWEGDIPPKTCYTLEEKDIRILIDRKSGSIAGIVNKIISKTITPLGLSTELLSLQIKKQKEKFGK